MRTYIISISFLAFLACENVPKTESQNPGSPKPDNSVTMPTSKRVIRHIADGQIQFADGTKEPIPNYDDPKHIVFFCVRHCEKAEDGTSNPPLTSEGEARAKRLGVVLDGLPIKRICTTNLKRTIRTGEALVPHLLAAPLETFPPQIQEDWLTEVLQNDKGSKFVVVGHQNTIPALLNRLVGKKEQYGWIPGDEFGNLYIVSTAGEGKTTVIEGCYE